MHCPYCSHKECKTAGFVLERQRYKCLKCEKHFPEKTFSAIFRHRHSADMIRGAVECWAAAFNARKFGPEFWFSVFP